MTSLIPMKRTELSNLLDSFEREMNNALAAFNITDELFGTFDSKHSYPKVNVYEQENEFVIDATVPGLAKEDVNIELTMENGKRWLTISASKQERFHEENINMIRNEIKLSAFKRPFLLPNNIDGTKISAKFDNGLLTVILPKVEQAEKKIEPVKIKVN